MRRNTILILAVFTMIITSCGNGKSSSEVGKESAQEKADRMTEELMREMEKQMEADTLNVEMEEVQEIIAE